MTEEQIIAAALRNRSARAGQIDRLASIKGEARTKAEALREATGRAQDARTGFVQMQGLRHIPNFFPTPRQVIDRMLELIEIEPSPERLAMDPNAGKGNLLEALRPLGFSLRSCEIMQVLAAIVRQKGFHCECADFLTLTPEGEAQRPDLMFMNPPFERGVDCKHIQHAFSWLRSETGRRCQLIAVCSRSTGFRLQEWAEYYGGSVRDLPDNAFANSENTTPVRTSILTVCN